MILIEDLGPLLIHFKVTDIFIKFTSNPQTKREIRRTTGCP